MTTLTEADVEAAALDWLAGVGWQVAQTGPTARRIRPAPSAAITAYE